MRLLYMTTLFNNINRVVVRFILNIHVNLIIAYIFYIDYL